MGVFQKKHGLRLAALGLAAANLLTLTSMPAMAADDSGALNEPGLWITEMYIDDVDTHTGLAAGEQMEFVEITNTAAEPISLADYHLYYEVANGALQELTISAGGGTATASYPQERA